MNFFEKTLMENSYEKKGSINKSLVPKLESMILEDNKEEEEPSSYVSAQTLGRRRREQRRTNARLKIIIIQKERTSQIFIANV